MSMPVVLRSTFDAAKAKAAEVEAELRREMATLREALERSREDHESALADRDRVAGALARARAEADRFAAAVAEKQGELAQAAKTLETQRHEAQRTLEAERAQAQRAAEIERTDLQNVLKTERTAREAEAAAREQTQIALNDAQGRLAQTAQRLEDFRAETARLGTQLTQVQAVHRADIEALARAAGERDRITARLKDFEGEAERLGQQVLQIINENREISSAADTARAEGATLKKKLQTLSVQLRAPAKSAQAAKSYFVVSSLGRTATQWQVLGLNRHPLVHVTHAFDLSKEKHDPASTGDDFLRSLERQASIRGQGLDLDAAFDLIESDDHRAFGNFHGLEILPAMERPETLRRPYRIFYQTRHPIMRLGSLVERWTYEASLDPSRRQSLKDEANRALTESKPPGADLSNDDAWLFAYAISYLLNAEARYLRSSAPVVLYERLLSDRDHFGWFVRQLVGNAVDFDEQMIDDFYGAAPVDKRGSSPLAAKTVHASWDDWQRAYFAQTLEQAGTRDHYAALGYEVEF